MRLKEIEEEIQNVNKDYSGSLKVLEKILSLTENLGMAYKSAHYSIKRKYLHLFFNKFSVKGEEIANYELSEDLKELIENGSVRVSATGLQRVHQVRTLFS
ncbi:hypothetical protein KC726_00910 [Candidatus Woesebacteria bacterium]|nr:hypothetical protein [Candidatus Woesebacteria bacterium]